MFRKPRFFYPDELAPMCRRIGFNVSTSWLQLPHFGGTSRCAWRCLVARLAVARQRLGGCSLSAKVQHWRSPLVVFGGHRENYHKIISFCPVNQYNSRLKRT